MWILNYCIIFPPFFFPPKAPAFQRSMWLALQIPWVERELYFGFSLLWTLTLRPRISRHPIPWHKHMQNDTYLYLHTTGKSISHAQHNFSFIVRILLPSLPLVVSLSRIKKVPLGFPNDSSCLSASFRPSLPKYHLREIPEIVRKMLCSITK